MDLDAQIEQTRQRNALEREQRELPLPPGVTMVKLKKQVTGLRVDPAGLAILSVPDGSWQQLARPVKVKRGKLMRSRVRIKLDDGSNVAVRPYLPKEKGLVDTGQRDSLYRGGGSSGSDDWLAAIFVLVIIVIVILPALYLSIREVSGLSPRCKVAATLKDQIGATITASKS